MMFWGLVVELVGFLCVTVFFALIDTDKFRLAFLQLEQVDTSHFYEWCIEKRDRLKESIRDSTWFSFRVIWLKLIYLPIMSILYYIARHLSRWEAVRKYILRVGILLVLVGITLQIIASR